jgi:hypothetical protein
MTSSAMAMDRVKVPMISFGELAHRILIDGDQSSLPSSRHQFPDRSNDSDSIYSGSTVSIFGGSSLASDDYAANQRGSRSSQSLPHVVPDAVANWFAFKHEAGLSDEDNEHPQRLSVLVAKTLRPVRVQL